MSTLRDGAIRDALAAAEWEVVPQYEDHHKERIADYLLIAKSPGEQRVVARVPYRSYADWLVERLTGPAVDGEALANAIRAATFMSETDAKTVADFVMESGVFRQAAEVSS